MKKFIIIFNTLYIIKKEKIKNLSSSFFNKKIDQILLTFWQ